MESEATSQTSKQTTIVVIFQEPIEKIFRPPNPKERTNHEIVSPVIRRRRGGIKARYLLATMLLLDILMFI
jgi:hypothetical protein